MISQLRKNLSENDKDLKTKKVKYVKIANKDYKDYKNFSEVATEKESEGKKQKALFSKKDAEELDKEVSLLRLINKATEMMYGQEIEIESQKTATFFFFGLIFSVAIFLVLWFLSFDFSVFGNYFNNIFCRVKPQ